MRKAQTKNILIRNIPIDVYEKLELSAKDHHRSKNQEAIVLLSEGLNKPKTSFDKPQPFKWPRKLKSKFILDSIDEGRP